MSSSAPPTRKPNEPSDFCVALKQKPDLDTLDLVMSLQYIQKLNSACSQAQKTALAFTLADKTGTRNGKEKNMGFIEDADNLPACMVNQPGVVPWEHVLRYISQELYDCLPKSLRPGRPALNLAMTQLKHFSLGDL